MLQTRGVGCCVEEREKRLLMLDVARNTGRNMAATWGRREERLLMLDVAGNRVRNIFVTHSQHAHNIYLVVFRSNG
jgi:hypothetical protein